MSKRIFICYRRKNKPLARLVERRLTQEFGDDVYLDFDDIGGGTRWKNEIRSAIEHAEIVVTLVTTVWNSRRNGIPRLLDEGDYVRFELETALEAGTPILPVQYEPARPPKPEQLPPLLRGILGVQFLKLSDERWDYDMDRLVASVRAVLGPPEPGTTAASAREPTTATPTAPKPARPGPDLRGGRPSWTLAGSSAIPSGSSSPPRPFAVPSLFSLTPEQRAKQQAEARAALEADEAARAAARAESPPFYRRWEYWLSVVVTLAVGVGVLILTDLMVVSIANTWTEFPDMSLGPALTLVSVVGASRCVAAALAYHHDPRPGARTFYTRGLLGGYWFWIEEFESFAALAAPPLGVGLPWVVGRSLAWLPFHFFDWSYTVVLWVVVGVLALFVVIVQGITVADEIDDLMSGD